ncbi:MAG: response regulator [Deltaproteobacteria bacterium]|nr:MAG: response regulator [Deltaproteobacteria bacterium]
MSDWKVLLVDDEKDFWEDLYDRLSVVFGKMNVLIASSGEEALQILKNQPIGVILSDQRMPGVSGHELLEEVSRRWPDVVRILLTAFPDIRSAKDSVNKGEIYQYVSKSTSLSEIESLVKSGLQKFESDEKTSAFEGKTGVFEKALY